MHSTPPGSELITTDLINRIDPFHPRIANLNLPTISYRANEGFSSYHSLGVAARYRTSRAQVHVAYTWSHSIDNQSEPLAGDFYNLIETRAGANKGDTLSATFSEQFNSRVDRGNSDYDQRHNLVVFGIWQVPQPPARSRGAIWLRDWRVSFLAALRSGFPYTVTANSLAQRLNVVAPWLLSVPRTPAAGGVQFFDRGAFYYAPSATQPNTGRNEFTGPGLYSVDVSLSRSWRVHSLGESTRVSLRADAFNVLNHANLGNPASTLLGSDFGVAQYGRRERQPNFPALTPFNEAARRIQLLLRFEF